MSLAFSFRNHNKIMNNEIHLPVAQLKQALPGFTKIIGRTNTLPALNHLRLQHNDDGQVLIRATNLDDFGSVRLAEKQLRKSHRPAAAI